MTLLGRFMRLHDLCESEEEYDRIGLLLTEAMMKARHFGGWFESEEAGFTDRDLDLLTQAGLVENRFPAETH